MRARLSGWPKNKLASKRGRSTCSSLDCIHSRALIGNYQCNSATDAHSREQEGDHFQNLIAPPEESQLKDTAEDTSSHRASRCLSPLSAASFLSNRMLRGHIILGVQKELISGLYGACLAYTFWTAWLKRSLHTLMSSLLCLRRYSASGASTLNQPLWMLRAWAAKW